MPELQKGLYDRAGGLQFLRENQSPSTDLVLGMPGNAQNALAQRALALSPYLRVIRQENSFHPEFTELSLMCEFEA